MLSSLRSENMSVTSHSFVQVLTQEHGLALEATGPFHGDTEYMKLNELKYTLKRYCLFVSVYVCLSVYLLLLYHVCTVPCVHFLCCVICLYLYHISCKFIVVFERMWPRRCSSPSRDLHPSPPPQLVGKEWEEQEKEREDLALAARTRSLREWRKNMWIALIWPLEESIWTRSLKFWMITSVLACTARRPR